jgi:hypothetical protein
MSVIQSTFKAMNSPTRTIVSAFLCLLAFPAALPANDVPDAVRDLTGKWEGDFVLDGKPVSVKSVTIRHAIACRTYKTTAIEISLLLDLEESKLPIPEHFATGSFRDPARRVAANTIRVKYGELCDSEFSFVRRYFKVTGSNRKAELHVVSVSYFEGDERSTDELDAVALAKAEVSYRLEGSMLRGTIEVEGEDRVSFDLKRVVQSPASKPVPGRPAPG